MLGVRLWVSLRAVSAGTWRDKGEDARLEVIHVIRLRVRLGHLLAGLTRGGAGTTHVGVEGRVGEVGQVGGIGQRPQPVEAGAVEGSHGVVAGRKIAGEDRRVGARGLVSRGSGGGAAKPSGMGCRSQGQGLGGGQRTATTAAGLLGPGKKERILSLTDGPDQPTNPATPFLLPGHRSPGQVLDRPTVNAAAANHAARCAPQVTETTPVARNVQLSIRRLGKTALQRPGCCFASTCLPCLCAQPARHFMQPRRSDRRTVSFRVSLASTEWWSSLVAESKARQASAHNGNMHAAFSIVVLRQRKGEQRPQRHLPEQHALVDSAISTIFVLYALGHIAR